MTREAIATAPAGKIVTARAGTTHRGYNTTKIQNVPSVAVSREMETPPLPASFDPLIVRQGPDPRVKLGDDLRQAHGSGLRIESARAQDGPAIGALLEAGGFPARGLDWTEVAPYWLIARRGGEVVGAVQVILGRPVGWLELLVVAAELDHAARARVVKRLIGAGMRALHAFGAQVAMGTVPFELKSYAKVVRRRGGVIAFSGHAFCKRLSDDR